jgi:hypothetical protein
VKEPFIKPAMFRDRNFAAGVLFVLIVGVVLFAPMSLLPPYMQDLMVIFATLPAQYRGDGTGIYTYARNIGSSVGISIVEAMLVNETQINHATIGQYATPFNRLFEHGVAAHYLSPWTAAGRALLDSLVSQQAQIIAYLDDLKLVMLATLIAVPLLLVYRKSSKGGTEPRIPGVD